ncbi:hypothetical protein KY290_011180 [Solanum tuberosum]|uniref:Uncharacterized protein n=1 Tax=Solanum tuberosum TaxID=4113 RepID=A0ABQ7W1W4_SOLTU|nr:hypothetical protein KY284_011199 [Solanum tuberosum]KAH0774043.1 hypothetical protein KY290_011180 [Solanum tuberosum]
MALDMGELETGRGLNQELGLVKVGDTHWGSHYKSFGNFISSVDSIVDVLDTLVENASTLEERASASGYLRKKGARHCKCHDSCKGTKEKVASFKR